MRTNKAFIVFTALFFVLGLTGYALAANTVTVTAENITQGSTCGKAGSFQIDFEPGTILTDGDQITMTLDLGVTICDDEDKAIDIVIAPEDGAPCSTTDAAVGCSGGDAWNEVDAVGNYDDDDIDSPVLLIESDNAGATDDMASTLGGVFFYLRGNDGAQIITLDVIGDQPGATLLIGNDDGDKLILSYFDGRLNDNSAVAGITSDFDYLGIWRDDDADDTYGEDPADDDGEQTNDLVHNTLCIDVSGIDYAQVKATMDSKDDIFKFTPSDPTIANIVSSQAFSLYDCKVSYDELTMYETETDQEDVSCTVDYIDIEDADGYCDEDADANDMKVIIEAGDQFQAGDYQIGMAILVNGENSADQGVYFTNETVLAKAYDDADEACDDAALGAGDLVASGGAGYFYEVADALEGADPDFITSLDPNDEWLNMPAYDGCDLVSETDEEEDAVLATTLVTSDDDLGISTGDEYLRIDVPAMVQDIDVIEEGDEVTLMIMLLKPPCTTLGIVSYDVGTFGCPDDDASGETTLIFPYFTQLNPDEEWWDGLAITNLGSGEGTASLTIYESDGDIWTVDWTVAAHAITANLISSQDFIDTLTLDADSTGDGTVDATSRAYVVADCDFSADGFAMLGEMTYGQAQGYLPRD